MRTFFRAFVLLQLIGASVAGWAETSSTNDANVSAKGTAAKESIAKTAAAKEVTSKENTKASTDTKLSKFLPSDVRVLIDVSGSMKQTDPQNLRKPALDLIVRLLPDKSRAGVWTFGNEVNMLVPHNIVDAPWRKQAAPKAEQINSIAMYTNIGKALDTVSYDRKNLGGDYKHHIILLTDGVVDINKEAVVNMKERQRILTEILPALKNAGYIVHTIALSADADADLLKKISIATDGVFTTAHSGEELMSTFLKIFDQAVPAERVPLENNGFLVDASIKEFTALIFRKTGVEQTIIVSPDGKEYSATNPHDGINLYHTDKYDLITADTPKPGQWKIKTDIAPQSRITVVSDLQLVVQGLKNNIHIGDPLPFDYSFQENGKTVSNKDFLSLLEVNAIIAKDGTEENTTLSLTATDIPADGVYHQEINTFANPGNYEVHLYVDGKTFKREFKHSLTVRDSLLVLEKSSATAEDGKVTYNYKITTDEKLVDLSKTQVSVNIKNTSNTNFEKTLNLVDNNHWEFSFTPVQDGDYTIDLHGQGELVEGGKLDETIHADKFTYHTKKEEPPVVKEEPKKEEPKPVEKPVEKNSNLLLYISIAVGNIIIFVLGYFAYRTLMGGKAKDELEEYEKTLAIDKLPEKKSESKPEIKKAESKPEKTEIDLSDEEPAHIPMSDDSIMDNLFPLDSMEEPKKDDEEF